MGLDRALGPTEEHRIALAMLSISPGERVLDVACGPGNFTRDFALAAGDGLVVGIDSSETMLGVAVRDNRDAATWPTCAAMPATCPFAMAASTRSAASPPCT